MRTLLTAVAIAAIAFSLIGGALVAAGSPCFAQCILNCPAGDGGVVGPGAGNKSPDLPPMAGDPGSSILAAVGDLNSVASWKTSPAFYKP